MLQPCDCPTSTRTRDRDCDSADPNTCDGCSVALTGTALSIGYVTLLDVTGGSRS